jgi:hypothetical protein
MQDLDSVERLYKAILPEPVSDVQGQELRRLMVWLQDDVCLLVDDYIGRPNFREKASWPLRAVTTGPGNDAQPVIEAVAMAICDCATALAKLESKSRVRSQLRNLYPPQNEVIEEKIAISGNGRSRVLSRQSGPVDVLAIELSQIKELAKGRFGELARVEDYFEPQQELVETESGKRLQRGELIVSVNPELHPIGNFIVRCMLRRVDGFMATLTEVHAKIIHAAQSLKRDYVALRKIDATWQQLLARLAALRKVFQGGPENQLRESCIILTQVYAAFSSSPALDWLDVPQEHIEGGIPSLRHRIKHSHNGEMFERIVAAVADLRRLYDDGAPEQQAIDEAIAAGGLVIDTRSLDVFWDGGPIRQDWKGNRRSWEFLVAVAKKVRLQGYVTDSDLGNNAQGNSVMAMRAKRLKELLPPSLRKQLIPGSVRRSYRLDLPPHLVTVVD